MDILLYLLVLVIYALPFIFIGLIIFILVYAVFGMIAFFSPFNNLSQEKNRRQRFNISLFLSFLLCVPCFFWGIGLYERNKAEKARIKEAPHKEAIDNFSKQLSINDRKRYWPAGTITTLGEWISNQDEAYKEELRRQLSSEITEHVAKNILSTDEADIVTIEEMANANVPEVRAYLRYNDKGLKDVWSPRTFERVPGRFTHTDQTDYVTYLKLVVMQCTVDPNAICHRTITKEKLDVFESESIYANFMKDFIPQLRAALGYDSIDVKNHCCDYSLPKR
ncbi:MAG: hypothetical protein EOO52_17775 [Gammaproteobacteria bacterium]|nr:MAG: hypothetical protein EOO52_17775 [Gammaproteobacteria bacterium]